MVAELLRLRLRLVGNLFRDHPGMVAGRVVALLVALVLIVFAFTGANALRESGPQFTVRAVISVGAFGSLAAFLVPVIVVRRELMSSRAFLGLQLRTGLVALALVVLTLVGPALLVVPLAFAPLRVWAGSTVGPAVLCALLLVFQALLCLRLGAAVGAALRARRRMGAWLRALAVVLLIVAALPAVSVIMTRLVPDHIAWARIALRAVRPIGSSSAMDVLASSPAGALWAAPAFARLGQGDRFAQVLAIGIATIVVLAAAWALVVRVQMKPTRRGAVVRRSRVPGWFGPLPTTPAGAVAARSISYWIRDPRYRAVFGILPVIPVFTLIALAIGGVSLRDSSLVPLPLMVLLLAWSTIHNDVAYDSTAIWQHLAAQTRGVHDRLGRIVPVLGFGVVLIAFGTPLTAWGHGDWRIVPAVLGVNLALLLGGVGVGSALSARLPYAAPRPGDAAFRAPQVAGDSGGGAQGLSLLLAALTAVPALVASGLWLGGIAGPWNWIALLAGVVSGGLALLVGVRSGGASFDRRGPELLAFTMRH